MDHSMTRPGRVWCFGDSNGAGWGLVPPERPFVAWVAQALGLEPCNRAEAGASLGLITQRLIQQHHQIQAQDLVLITVPPDSRWYGENRQGWYSLAAADRDQYLEFLGAKTLRWFQYHHSLFLYAQQRLLEQIGVTWIWIETYGQMRLSNIYGLPIRWDRALSELSMVDLLSGQRRSWQSYPWHLPRSQHFDQDGPQGDYDPEAPGYLGTDGHANERGHREIARLVLEHPLVQQWQVGSGS